MLKLGEFWQWERTLKVKIDFLRKFRECLRNLLEGMTFSLFQFSFFRQLNDSS